MPNRTEREQELIHNGFYSGIKEIYKGTAHNIPDKYFMLIADYIETLTQIEDMLGIDAKEIALMLPDILKSVEESNINLYGITEGTTITMNSNMSYEKLKLYFFHELTHILQTRKTLFGVQCSFANSRNGSFLMEGLTQYTAECLYNFSNGSNITYAYQTDVVRGQSNHTCYSPLSEYQLNGNILSMLSQVTNIDLMSMMGLGYKKEGRDILKKAYESIDGNRDKFEKLMDDLEKIYVIDKFMVVGQGYVVNGAPQLLRFEDGRTFMGNLEIQAHLINEVERELMGCYIKSHDKAYILENYHKFEKLLTTKELKKEFLLQVDKVEKEAMQLVNTRR